MKQKPGDFFLLVLLKVLYNRYCTCVVSKFESAYLVLLSGFCSMLAIRSISTPVDASPVDATSSNGCL